MYIDERLIKILETHKEEQIHVTYAIDLVKKIAKEYEAQTTQVVASCHAVFNGEHDIIKLYQTKEKAENTLLKKFLK